MSYLWDGRVESRDLKIGVGWRGAVPLHGYQPGRGHLVGILGKEEGEVTYRFQLLLPAALKNKNKEKRYMKVFFFLMTVLFMLLSFRKRVIFTACTFINLTAVTRKVTQMDNGKSDRTVGD